MVKRFPHTLKVTYKSEGSFTSGNFTPGSDQTVEIEGRAEPNSRGRLISLEDGGQVVYEWVFYCKSLEGDIPFGSRAEITELNWKGHVARAVQNQTNARIWL